MANNTEITKRDELRIMDPDPRYMKKLRAEMVKSDRTLKYIAEKIFKKHFKIKD